MGCLGGRTKRDRRRDGSEMVGSRSWESLLASRLHRNGLKTPENGTEGAREVDEQEKMLKSTSKSPREAQLPTGGKARARAEK